MKTLNQYISNDMKSFKTSLKESILDDEDDIMDDGVRAIIKSFIDTHYEVSACNISREPNSDGKYEVNAGYVRVKKKNITHLTNDLFVWYYVDQFSCTDCIPLMLGFSASISWLS